MNSFKYFEIKEQGCHREELMQPKQILLEKCLIMVPKILSDNFKKYMSHRDAHQCVLDNTVNFKVKYSFQFLVLLVRISIQYLQSFSECALCQQMRRVARVPQRKTALDNGGTNAMHKNHNLNISTSCNVRNLYFHMEK